MRVYRRVADENVDPTPGLARLGDEVFQLRLVGDPCGDGNSFAAFGPDGRCNLLTWRRVAGRDDDFPASLGERLGDRPADPTTGTGNDRYFFGQIEKPHDTSPQHCMTVFRSCGIIRPFGRGSG